MSQNKTAVITGIGRDPSQPPGQNRLFIRVECECGREHDYPGWTLETLEDADGATYQHSPERGDTFTYTDPDGIVSLYYLEPEEPESCFEGEMGIIETGQFIFTDAGWLYYEDRK